MESKVKMGKCNGFVSACIAVSVWGTGIKAKQGAHVAVSFTVLPSVCSGTVASLTTFKLC